MRLRKKGYSEEKLFIENNWIQGKRKQIDGSPNNDEAQENRIFRRKTNYYYDPSNAGAQEKDIQKNIWKEN